MTLLFIFLFAIIFSVIAWRKLDQAVLLTVLLLPTYLLRFDIGVPSTVLEVMIGIVFVVWVIRNRGFLSKRWKEIATSKPLHSQSYPFRWLLIAWLLVSFIAVGIAGWDLAAFGVWRAYFFEPALLYIVVVNIFNTKDKLICLLGAFGLSVVAVSLFAIYQFITGDFIPNEFWAGNTNRRATSFFPFPNAVGLYVAPILLLLLGHLTWLVKTRKSLGAHIWEYASSGLGIILGFLAIITARSEGAALAVIAAAIVFGLLASKKSRLITAGIIIVGGIVLGVVQPLQTYVFDKVMLRDFSGQVRRAQWKETWKMLRDDRIITGAGLAQYQKAVKPYHQEGIFVKDYHDPDFQKKVVFNAVFRDSVWQPLEIYLYPHNVMLNFWTELGLAGVIIFSLLVISFCYYGFSAFCQAYKTNDPFRYIILGVTLALLVSLIHGIVDVPYLKNDLAALFWILFAMMGVISIMYHKQVTKN